MPSGEDSDALGGEDDADTLSGEGADVLVAETDVDQVAGVTVVGWFVTSQTLPQKWVPDRYRGRVFGAYETTQALTLLVGMGVAVALEGLLGVIAVLSLVGAVWSLAGVVAWSMLPHDK